jgi:beta-galactosidase/beta-glucuronidase
MSTSLISKQIKVEPRLFYYMCDQYGIMLIQDMPALKADGSIKPTVEQQAEFERQLGLLIQQHKSYPSIVTWVSVENASALLYSTCSPSLGYI